jgi:hypothetical protein
MVARMPCEPSKFESSRAEIEKVFRGPYPLDKHIISGLLSRLPGVYIWFERLGDRDLGYVGMSTDLLDRLGSWCGETAGAQVFYVYATEEIIPQLERKWIRKAGDLNKV